MRVTLEALNITLATNEELRANSLTDALAASRLEVRLQVLSLLVFASTKVQILTRAELHRSCRLDLKTATLRSTAVRAPKAEEYHLQQLRILVAGPPSVLALSRSLAYEALSY